MEGPTSNIIETRSINCCEELTQGSPPSIDNPQSTINFYCERFQYPTVTVTVTVLTILGVDAVPISLRAVLLGVKQGKMVWRLTPTIGPINLMTAFGGKEPILVGHWNLH